jgi:RNA polymerase sigma-70 factor (ECF subfamily)
VPVDPPLPPVAGPDPGPSERALFARLAAGDEAAFDALFRATYAPLVRVATYHVHDAGVAEELVQEVWLEIWRRRASLALDEEPRRYLLRSVRNRALNHLRHERVVARTAGLVAPEAAAPATAPAEVDARDLDAAITAAVAALPPRCRAVFEMSRRDGRSHAEIAAALDIAPKTVENQMGKALRLLRAALAPWLPARDDGAD